MQKLLEDPPEKDYVLEVGVRVRRSTGTYNPDLLESVRDGLKRAYLDARRKELSARPKRSLSSEPYPSPTEEGDDVTVQVRFFTLEFFRYPNCPK